MFHTASTSHVHRYDQPTRQHPRPLLDRMKSSTCYTMVERLKSQHVTWFQNKSKNMDSLTNNARSEEEPKDLPQLHAGSRRPSLERQLAAIAGVAVWIVDGKLETKEVDHKVWNSSGQRSAYPSCGAVGSRYLTGGMNYRRRRHSLHRSHQDAGVRTLRLHRWPWRRHEGVSELALSYMRSNGAQFGIKPKVFKGVIVHPSVPREDNGTGVRCSPRWPTY